MEDNVRVIERVFDILEVLAKASTPLGLTEVARAAEISKSTAFRLLGTMVDRQYVQKDSRGGYSIGYQMIETVSCHINSLELLTEAKPFLSMLRGELNLTAHLGILEQAEVVYLEKLDLYPGIRQYTRVGYRSPAYCSSIGKCLLACLSGAELNDILAQFRLQAYTENTISDAVTFKKHLKQVRKQGWAMDDEEYQTGHRCVGAPVFDYRGMAVAALSVSGTVHSLADELLPEVIKKVKLQATGLSRQLGYVS